MARMRISEVLYFVGNVSAESEKCFSEVGNVTAKGKEAKGNI